MYKLIAFDLDGTVLDNNGTLSKITQDYFQTLLNKKIILIPCSARSLFEYPAWFKDHLSIPYLITHNGAIIVDNLTKKEITNHTLTKEKALEICEHLSFKNNLLTLNYENYMISTLDLYNFLLPQDTPFKKEMFKHPARLYAFNFKHFIKQKDGITKIHVSLPFTNDKEELYQLMEEIEDVYVQSSHPNNIEVTHPNANKGSALNLLLEKLKIKSNQVIAFGDNDNDISLLEIAGHKVAINNATTRLKAVADVVTIYDNDNDGVVKYLKTFLK